MSESCCDSNGLEKLHKSQAKVLWIVLFVNAIMFVVELSSGVFAGSLALVGDSMDMLGDTLAYGASLHVIHHGTSAKIKAARFKAILILIAGTAVFAQAVYRFIFREVPDVEIMNIVALIALAANILCLVLLTKHRNDDLNFRSVWICSRNDIVANVSVLVAGGAVFLTQSVWPDLIVGVGILVFFYRSGFFILKEANEARL